MEKNILKTCLLLSYLCLLLSCDKEKLPKELKDTQWQLLEMVDVETGERVIPEPEYSETGESCFYMTIDNEGIARIRLEVMTYTLNLIHTDGECEDIWYEYKFTGNGKLFYSALRCSKNGFSHENGEFKLYCNSNKSYLRFKPVEK